MNKKCNKCLHILPISSFGKKKTAPDGLAYWCKECNKNYIKEWKNNQTPSDVEIIDKKAKKREYGRKWRAQNLQRSRDLNNRWANENQETVKNGLLKRQYGITLNDYKDMLLRQNNACAICKTPQDSFSKCLAVDHCHTTGIIRGLLCDKCNRGLGYFQDNPEYLSSAVEFLTNRMHKEKK